MFLTLLTFISAISISVIAAGYSIVGLATLFAGAAVPIIAMGTALEIGKLVAASWLYQNWRSDVPRLLKAYLFTSIIVLIFITSMGIFGFLSKAHLDQLDKALDVYIDKEYVTRGLKERNKQKEERDLLNKTIDEATSKILELNKTKNTIELEQLKIEAEVGPLKYVAELIYGDEAKNHFDSAVRIVILILIFVFDPLAVLLLIAANISLRQWRMKKNLTKSVEKEDLQKKIDTLNKKVRKLRGYQGLVKEFGDNPDEIKLKLNQIYDWNDKK